MGALTDAGALVAAMGDGAADPVDDRIELIEEAIRLTRLAGEVEVTEANVLLERRAALVVRAGLVATRDVATARRKAQELVAADRALIKAVWRRHAETFDWFAERAPDEVDKMPSLRRLASERP